MRWQFLCEIHTSLSTFTPQQNWLPKQVRWFEFFLCVKMFYSEHYLQQAAWCNFFFLFTQRVKEQVLFTVSRMWSSLLRSLTLSALYWSIIFKCFMHRNRVRPLVNIVYLFVFKFLRKTLKHFSAYSRQETPV